MANTLKFGNGEWYGKKDTILAYNDENNNYKPLPFDFTRASSATVVNKDGLIEEVGSGQPRIDYKDDSKGALLLEPSRSNIITNSNSSNLNFTLDNVSMTYNSTTSPDGENNGILLKQTGSNASNSAYNFGLTTADGTYTYSIFIKANDSEKFRFYSSNGTTLTQDFNPQEMTEGVVSGALNLKFESYGNDWFRVSFTRTLSSASHHRFSIYPDRNNTQKSVYIFGLQIESNASYATSYIPTQGSAVTRLAESSSQTPPDGVIGQTEGTIFVDVDFKTLSGTNMFVSIRPDASNKIEIYRSDAIIYGEFASNASFNFNKPSVTVGRYKIAVAYSSGSSAMYINGVLIGSNTTPFAFASTLDDVYINSRGTSFTEQSSYNDVRLYNTRLSNSELQALTQV